MDVITGLLLAAVTVGLIAAGFTVWSVVAIANRARRQRSLPDAGLRAQERLAGSALVRLDDAIRDAADELGFAIAQFGADEVRDFRDALERARADAREAFELQQRLDDGIPDTERQRREWTARIVTLCERATAALNEHDRQFEARRRREVAAPAELDRLRAAIESARARIATMPPDELPSAVAGSPSAASALLDDATRGADQVASSLQHGSLQPVGPALHDARRAVARADALLDGVDRALQEQTDAAAHLAEATDEARADLQRARALRDSHEVPAHREALNAAIGEVTEAIDRAGSASVDPVETLTGMRRASARLDAAVAAAVSAEQRLTQARTALAGALRQAERHIAAASDVIAANRGRVGSQARTRLSEAERQLALARDDADPVAALDAARRASMRAQDADALARYDAMH